MSNINILYQFFSFMFYSFQFHILPHSVVKIPIHRSSLLWTFIRHAIYHPAFVLIEGTEWVFTRDQIGDVLSMNGAYEGFHRTIDAHIKNLRKALQATGCNGNIIETVRGVGYKFVIQNQQIPRTISELQIKTHRQTDKNIIDKESDNKGQTIDIIGN